MRKVILKRKINRLRKQLYEYNTSSLCDQIALSSHKLNAQWTVSCNRLHRQGSGLHCRRHTMISAAGIEPWRAGSWGLYRFIYIFTKYGMVASRNNSYVESSPAPTVLPGRRWVSDPLWVAPHCLESAPSSPLTTSHGRQLLASAPTCVPAGAADANCDVSPLP